MRGTAIFSAAVVMVGMSFADDDNQALTEKRQSQISVSISTNDAANGTVVVDGNAVATGGKHPGQVDHVGLQIKHLQEAFDKLPADDPARKHLEAHVLKLLDIGANGQAPTTRVTSIATSARETVIVDDAHRITLSAKDGFETIKVEDREGAELFAGPWNTEADKAKAPPEIREKLATHQAAVQIDTTTFKDLKLGEHPQIKPVKPGAKAHPNKGEGHAQPQHRRPLRDADGHRVY